MKEKDIINRIYYFLDDRSCIKNLDPNKIKIQFSLQLADTVGAKKFVC